MIYTPSMPLISIMTPVYNGQRDLPGCLDSVHVALQALGDAETAAVEYVVSNNHSTDATDEILASSVVPMKIVKPSEFSENRTVNWNTGLFACSGEWLMMLHADDRIDGTGLRALLRVLPRVPGDVAIVFGKHQRFDDSGNVGGGPAPHSSKVSVIDGSRFRSLSLEFGCPFPPFVVFRRSLFESLGGMNPDYHLAQDWDLWLRMAPGHRLVYLPVTLGQWRSHPYDTRWSQVKASERMQLAKQVTPDAPVRRVIISAVAASNARHSAPEVPFEQLSSIPPLFDPGKRGAKAIVRLSQYYMRAVNRLLRAGGARSVTADALQAALRAEGSRS